MATSERLDFSQPMNDLGQIGEEQRKKLFPKNDYKEQNKLTIEKTDLLNKYSDSYLNSLSKQEGYMTVGNQLVKVESAYSAALNNKINLLGNQIFYKDNITNHF